METKEALDFLHRVRQVLGRLVPEHSGDARTPRLRI